jgi:histidine triad (HIT) family protein
MDCLFCKIAAGVIPSKAVYQDEQCLAIADINPQSPVHFLVIPQEHIPSTAHASPAHAAMLGHLLLTAAQIARDKGLERGYRIVINTGTDGGQTVDHLHVHVLGGRRHTWPPG